MSTNDDNIDAVHAMIHQNCNLIVQEIAEQVGINIEAVSYTHLDVYKRQC